ncbi:MAG: TMEM175 family protein [Oenococcus sp.]|uniref:TMEM175 family protein n=1 Tax=Oenococcus TaxID=46254 RepID=UPI0021E85981|nr:TMEM175 family protein [Oenococcus kitaharae]MCV3296420.1 TMEM175 family protein [Oenococcus kitaharae]
MNKNRLEAFTDAIIAILVTIMVLEFHVPHTASWQALVQENGVYFLAYIIAFADVGVSWYNHHYLFAIAQRINKNVYWSNMLWVLALSLIPFAVAFIGAHPNSRVPAIFYLLVNAAWAASYLNLSKQIAAINQESAEAIKQMPVYKFLRSIWWIAYPISLIILFFWPPIVLLLAAVEITITAFKSNNPELDKLEK